MKIIDLHCDTLLKLVEENRPVEFFKRNNCWHIDLERLKASDYYLQFFGFFRQKGRCRMAMKGHCRCLVCLRMHV